MSSFQPFSAEPMATFAGQSGRKGPKKGGDNYYRVTRKSVNYKQLTVGHHIQIKNYEKTKDENQIDPDNAVTEQSTKDKSAHIKKKGRQVNIQMVRQSIPAKLGIAGRSFQDRTNESVQFSVSSKYKNSDKKDSEASHTPSQNSRFRMKTPILISRPQSQITGREGGSCGSEREGRVPDCMPLTHIAGANLRSNQSSSSKGIKMRIRSSHQPGRSGKTDSLEPLRLKKHARVESEISKEIKSFTTGEFYKPTVKVSNWRNKTGKFDGQSNQLLEDQKNKILDKLTFSPLNDTYTGASLEMRPLKDRSNMGSRRLSECLSNCLSEQASPIPSPLQLQRPTSLELNSMPVFENLIRGPNVGEGSFGVVYTMLDKTNGKVYAVKEMKTYSDDPRIRYCKSFENEIDILSKVDHQNVLKYYGYSKEEGKLRIITDYMEEGSIKTIMNEIGPLPLSLIKLYTRQIVQGLKYLHSKGIVHRDLKCENVLVDSKGNVKLADLGSSVLNVSLVDKSNAHQIAELSGPSKGSFLWSAPEIFTGEAYGRRVDIWSLGCTVFEMATNKPPWHDNCKTLSQLCFNIAHHRTLDVAGHDIDQSVKDFIAYCCVMDKNTRPTASQILSHSFLN